MPLLFTEVDVSSILSQSAVNGKVVKQSNYTGLWFKKSGANWLAYTTQPNGTVVERDFTALVPSPATDVVYNPSYGAENTIRWSTGGNAEFYWDSATSKFKCGRPNDR